MLKSKLRALLAPVMAGACLALAACGGVVMPQTPAQGVFALRGTLIAALSLANAYEDQPPCVASSAPGYTPLCSDPAIVARINAAAPTAGALLNSAVAVVSDKTSSLAAQQQALDQAASAVSGFQALIPPTTPKPAASIDGAVRLAQLGG